MAIQAVRMAVMLSLVITGIDAYRKKRGITSEPRDEQATDATLRERSGSSDSLVEDKQVNLDKALHQKGNPRRRRQQQSSGGWCLPHQKCTWNDCCSLGTSCNTCPGGYHGERAFGRCAFKGHFVCNAQPVVAAAVVATPAPTHEFDAVNCPHNAQNPPTCWGDSAYQKCPINRQGAYDAVMAKAPSMKEMHDKYVSLLDHKIGCTEAEEVHDFDATHCPHNAQNPPTCWGDSAYQMCPINRQGAYDAVMAKAPSMKQMHDEYVRLLAGKIDCTEAEEVDAFDATHCPHNAQNPPTCWGDSAYQKCPINRQGAYDAVMAKAPSMKQMHDEYVRLLAGKIGCTEAEEPDVLPEKLVDDGASDGEVAEEDDEPVIDEVEKSTRDACSARPCGQCSLPCHVRYSEISEQGCASCDEPPSVCAQRSWSQCTHECKKIHTQTDGKQKYVGCEARPTAPPTAPPSPEPTEPPCPPKKMVQFDEKMQQCKTMTADWEEVVIPSECCQKLLRIQQDA